MTHVADDRLRISLLDQLVDDDPDTVQEVAPSPQQAKLA